MVRTRVPFAYRDHRVHDRRLCTLSTRAGPQAYAANGQSSPGRGALRVSLSYGQRHSCRRLRTFPALLPDTISAWLWSAWPRHSYRPSHETSPAGCHTAYGGRSSEVLAKLPHLSRSRPGGLDAPRWPALL